MKYVYLVSALLCTACVVYQEPVRHVHHPVRVVEYEPATQAVVSIYVEPPLIQPHPIACPWAPPPMLVEAPPPLPFAGAVWTGGYWVWEGDWVWAHGRWSAPPHVGYHWIHPYYENRAGLVVFITGHWAAPNITFVPPPPNIHIDVVLANPGVVRGLRPVGPPGVFIPAPPGSRLGLIVPAPLGTPPAVVTSAPPVVREGMRIQHTVNNSNNTTIINNNTVINNVTIVAPPTATASGRSVRQDVVNDAHTAAGLAPVVQARAPQPINATPIPAFTPNRGAVTLPPPQTIKPVYHSAAEHKSAQPQAPLPQVKPAVITPPVHSAETQKIEPKKIVDPSHPVDQKAIMQPRSPSNNMVADQQKPVSHNDMPNNHVNHDQHQKGVQSNTPSNNAQPLGLGQTRPLPTHRELAPQQKRPIQENTDQHVNKTDATKHRQNDVKSSHKEGKQDERKDDKKAEHHHHDQHHHE